MTNRVKASEEPFTEHRKQVRHQAQIKKRFDGMRPTVFLAECPLGPESRREVGSDIPSEFRCFALELLICERFLAGFHSVVILT